jgi:hypothetical protein
MSTPRCQHEGSRAASEIVQADRRKPGRDRQVFETVPAVYIRRAVNAPHLVALVRAGATFVNGELVERPDEHPQPEAA